MECFGVWGKLHFVWGLGSGAFEVGGFDKLILGQLEIYEGS